MVPAIAVAASMFERLWKRKRGATVQQQWRFVTDWAVAAARFITPQYVLPVFLPLIGAFWLFVLRHVYFVILSNAGAAPSLGLP